MGTIRMPILSSWGSGNRNEDFNENISEKFLIDLTKMLNEEDDQAIL